jgi:tripartite ATP-independent transporter DctP family solute receptor
MKRQMCKLITGLLLALFVAGSHMAVAEAKTLSLGHTGQEVNIFSQASVKFAEYVNEYSDGKIEVKVMGAGALGDNREGIEQLQLGVTDFWVISTGLLAPFTNAVALYDLPYLFKSAEAGIAFFNSDIAMEIIQPLENKGIKGLGYMTQGWRHIHSNKPVRSPEDLAGMKIRTMSTPIHIELFKALGANAIPMAFSEVFTSLQQGIIDGGENPFENIKAQGFDKVQKCITMDGHVLDPMVLVISLNTWNSLSDREKEVIQNAATEACKWDQEHVLAANRASMEEFKAAGSPEIIELTAEERRAFREASQPIYDAYLPEIGEDLYKKVVDFQKDFEEVPPQN